MPEDIPCSKRLDTGRIGRFCDPEKLFLTRLDMRTLVNGGHICRSYIWKLGGSCMHLSFWMIHGILCLGLSRVTVSMDLINDFCV